MDWTLILQMFRMLQTPLTNIIELLQAVLEGSIDDKAERDEFLQRALGSALHLLNQNQVTDSRLLG